MCNIFDTIFLCGGRGGKVCKGGTTGHKDKRPSRELACPPCAGGIQGFYLAQIYSQSIWKKNPFIFKETDFGWLKSVRLKKGIDSRRLKLVRFSARAKLESLDWYLENKFFGSLHSISFLILFSILLTHEGSHREVYRDFQPSLTSSAAGTKGFSDHRFRAPPAYTVPPSEAGFFNPADPRGIT